MRGDSHFRLIDGSTPIMDTASLPTFHPFANTQLPDLITPSPCQTPVSPHVPIQIGFVISRLYMLNPYGNRLNKNVPILLMHAEVLNALCV